MNLSLARPSRIWTLILAALLPTVSTQRAMTQEKPVRPNVLFISVDDLNDWVGCLKAHPQVKTPNIDRLAARGTLFTNAHCQAPLCNPSRTSLLMGMRPSTTGVYALQPWFRTSPEWAKHVTLPQYFKQHGYRTLTVGKVYHAAFPPPSDRHLDFDVFGTPKGKPARPAKKFVETPDGLGAMDWGVFPERDDQQPDWQIASWAVEQLKSGAPQPFFLSVGFHLPHVPCYASQQWFDLYPEESLIMPVVKEDDRADTPAFSWYLHWKLPEPRLSWLRQANQWKPLVRAYLASISFMDSQVGRLLDALEEAKLTDNTVVVLWSDHGWHLGEKAISGKNTLWERSTRVPLVFAGPGIVQGARCSRSVELLDLYPTLVELCDLPERSGLEGHSIVPQLKEANAERRWPAITTHNPDNHTVRSENWRYIRYADGSQELYDLTADPNEWTNLAADSKHADIIREHARWLPQRSAEPMPGSQSRLLTYRNGVAEWELKPIVASEKDK